MAHPNQPSAHEGAPGPEALPEWSGLPFLEWDAEAQADAVRDFHFWKKAHAEAAALIALNSPLKKAYEKTLRCRAGIHYDAAGQRRSPPRCRKRWCFNCRRAEWGRIVHGYLDPLREAGRLAGGLYFVTLTTRACAGEDLETRIDRMKQDQAAVRDKVRRAHGHFHWFQTLEVAKTARQITLYRPHYHLIVAGEHPAREMVRLWLDRHAEAEPAHQFVAPIAAGTGMGTYDVGEDEPLTLYGLQGVLAYLAKGLIPPYAFTPEEADLVYRATQHTHVTRSSCGLQSLVPRAAAPDRGTEGPLPADRGAVYFDPEGLIDLHTGELVQP